MLYFLPTYIVFRHYLARLETLKLFLFTLMFAKITARILGSFLRYSGLTKSVSLCCRLVAYRCGLFVTVCCVR